MARLTEPRLLVLFLEALRNQARFDGFVKWEQLPSNWVRTNLESQTIKEINRLMLNHVEHGEEIDQIREQRPEFAVQHEFHYDLRLKIDDRHVYLETVLDETITGPEVIVVNAHWK